MMATAWLMKPGGFLSQMTTEDVAMILASSAPVKSRRDEGGAHRLKTIPIDPTLG
jgi:hypothetical protein